MKISQLIAELSSFQERLGDTPVFVSANYGEGDSAKAIPVSEAIWFSRGTGKDNDWGVFLNADA